MKSVEEGHVFPFSCKSTKITTEGCWTSINSESARTHQKKIAHIKRQRSCSERERCVITIKSNPIPARSVTQKLENNDTKGVLHCCESSEPTSGFPAWGSNKRAWKSPRNLTLEGLTKDWNRDPGFWSTNKTLWTPRPRGKERVTTGDGTKTTC